MRLQEKFKELKDSGQGAFMAHVYYGDPEPGFSLDLVRTLLDNGVDILELGIPFSDPTADGSTFIRACSRALQSRMTPKKCIETIKDIRGSYTQPIIVTSYFNIVYQYGIEKFIRDIREAGADGLIIPEAVIEEAEELADLGKKYGLAIIFIIGPNSSRSRIIQISAVATGFIYNVSLTGVTGARDELSAAGSLEAIRDCSQLPVLTGFGVSNPGQVKKLLNSGSDGVIVGSAFAGIYEKYIIGRDIAERDRCLREIADFVREMKKECKK